MIGTHRPSWNDGETTTSVSVNSSANTASDGEVTNSTDLDTNVLLLRSWSSRRSRYGSEENVVLLTTRRRTRCRSGSGSSGEHVEQDVHALRRDEPPDSQQVDTVLGSACAARPAA